MCLKREMLMKDGSIMAALLVVVLMFSGCDSRREPEGFDKFR